MADKKSIFNEDNIRLNASFATKEEAIRAAGQILADNGYVKEEYIDDMLKREEVVSTYIGNHIGDSARHRKIRRKDYGFRNFLYPGS